MMKSRTNQVVLCPNRIRPKPRTISRIRLTSRELLKSLIIIGFCTGVEVMKPQKYMYHVAISIMYDLKSLLS